jgi:hypothetical protein
MVDISHYYISLFLFSPEYVHFANRIFRDIFVYIICHNDMT